MPEDKTAAKQDQKQNDREVSIVHGGASAALLLYNRHSFEASQTALLRRNIRN